ncbi:hypothetical protein BGX38DRAFT_1271170 [Terfezia claveryi]|nr:hypothetical protein BGX38DRAFT_1271170 [Terfezia claveryi]
MRQEHLVDKTKSGELSLALSPIHSLISFLLPNKVVSRADVSETHSCLRDDTIKVTTPKNVPSWKISKIGARLLENDTSIVDNAKATITPVDIRSYRIGNIERVVVSSGTPPIQGPVDSIVLSTTQKIGIGIGVPLAIICLALVTCFCTKRHLLRSMRLRNRESNVGGEGAFSELDAGKADVWYPGGYDSAGGAKLPSSQHIGSPAGCSKVNTGGPLSGKQPVHPLAGVPEDQYNIRANTGARIMADDLISYAHQKATQAKRRPADLQPLALSAAHHRPFAASQASPGLLPHSGMNSPQVRQGHQSTVSSKSSSTLGLTAFFSSGQGHERHGSASTRISHKSRKGSTATMMTSNYEIEMATLSSASEPQFPITPRDYDTGGIYTGRVYRNSGYSYFDSEREEIAPIKSSAYIRQSQPPIFTPPVSSSPSLNTRSWHRHSRTSSSGIHAANFINSIPPVYSSPKVRPGTLPLAAGAGGQIVKKEDIRVIKYETAYFDDRNEEEGGDVDVDSLHSNLPQISADKPHSRRGSASLKRMSKGQAEEVDGEEVWTDTDEEQDSDFIIAGGLGSRFGKKIQTCPLEEGTRVYLQ